VGHSKSGSMPFDLGTGPLVIKCLQTMLFEDIDKELETFAHDAWAHCGITPAPKTLEARRLARPRDSKASQKRGADASRNGLSGKGDTKADATRERTPQKILVDHRYVLSPGPELSISLPLRMRAHPFKMNFSLLRHIARTSFASSWTKRRPNR
jgi:hypothetical protein